MEVATVREVNVLEEVSFVKTVKSSMADSPTPPPAPAPTPRAPDRMSRAITWITCIGGVVTILGLIITGVLYVVMPLADLKENAARKKDMADLATRLEKRTEGHEDAILEVVQALKARKVAINEEAVKRHLSKGKPFAWDHRLVCPPIPGALPFREGDRLIFLAAESGFGPVVALAGDSGVVSSVGDNSVSITLDSGSQNTSQFLPDGRNPLALLARGATSTEIFMYEGPQMTIVVKKGQRVSRDQRIGTINARPLTIPSQVTMRYLRDGKAVPPPSTIREARPNRAEGVFLNFCFGCHYDDSSVARIGPGLKGIAKKGVLPSGSPASKGALLKVINEGGNGMPAFKNILSAEQRELVIDYVLKL